MSELNYKELQEQGVFDVPYRAFEFMQSQQAKIDELNEKHSEEKRILHNVVEMNQAKIDELQARVDEALKHLYLAYPESWGYCVDESINILKGNKDEN